MREPGGLGFGAAPVETLRPLAPGRYEVIVALDPGGTHRQSVDVPLCGFAMLTITPAPR